MPPMSCEENPCKNRRLVSDPSRLYRTSFEVREVSPPQESRFRMHQSILPVSPGFNTDYRWYVVHGSTVPNPCCSRSGA